MHLFPQLVFYLGCFLIFFPVLSAFWYIISHHQALEKLFNENDGAGVYFMIEVITLPFGLLLILGSYLCQTAGGCIYRLVYYRPVTTEDIEEGGIDLARVN